MQPLNVRLPDDLLAWLDERAEHAGVNRSTVVRRALSHLRNRGWGFDGDPTPVRMPETATPSHPSAVATRNACPHPPVRRVGRRCSLCGRDVGRLPAAAER